MQIGCLGKGFVTLVAELSVYQSNILNDILQNNELQCSKQFTNLKILMEDACYIIQYNAINSSVLCL